MPASFDVPKSSLLPASAQRFPEPPAEPATPRDAATVLLLRDAADGDGVEVFLQRRVTAMAFAAGMTVFPGGGVDRRDADVSLRWAGPPPEEWARRFGCAEPTARALVCAAVRETFEESGVLLAGTDTEPVADTTGYAGVRQALVSRELSLAGFLADAGFTLRADLLHPWANWLTPEIEPRRYDTYFFAATVPDGQAADGATTEAESSGWQRPGDAIAEARAGRCALLPPTWYLLDELAHRASVADALEAERSIAKITPTLTVAGEFVHVEVP